MEYTLEEVIPIVARLVRKYTSGESTSVTYEKANQLMEAVFYCIHECEGSNQPVGLKRVSAEAAYQYGYEKVIQKVMRTQSVYNEMIASFDAYGNDNYYDTVTKGLAGFFRYYDARFAPQESIITMDYPTLVPIYGVTGIDAVEKYVQSICAEQRFMGRLPRDYIVSVLLRFQKGYKTQMYNICEIVLHHILAWLMIHKKPDATQIECGYLKMNEIIDRYSQEELTCHLTKLLENLIQKEYDGDSELFTYLQSNMEEFAFRLKQGKMNNRIRKILAL